MNASVKLQKNVKKITVGGLLIALALVLPMAFHLTGVPQPGQVFLPMHIREPSLGPVFGFFVGLFSPIISSVLTGMPAVGRLPFMMIELAVYGLVSGLMYNTFKFNKKKMGTYISLLTAMLCGRIVYAISLFVAVNLMGIQCGGPIAAVTATIFLSFFASLISVSENTAVFDGLSDFFKTSPVFKENGLIP